MREAGREAQEWGRLATFAKGSASGGVAALALQPLDVVKTRLQGIGEASSARVTARAAVREVWRQDGASGFWRGLAPSLVRATLGPGVYFVILDGFQQGRSRAAKREQNVGRVFMEGAVARGVAGALLCPLTVVKTRVEWARGSAGREGMLHMLARIAREERLGGLFSGLLPTLVRDLPSSGLYLVLYQSAFQPWAFRAFGGAVSEPVLNLGSALAAGGLAALVTHPADVLKTHVQIHGGSLRAGCASLWAARGAAGFFSGVGTRMLRRPLSMGITWTVYEFCTSR